MAIIVGAGLASVLLAGAAWASVSSRGGVTIHGKVAPYLSSSCTSGSLTGQSILVKDGSGTIIGEGTLGAGTMEFQPTVHRSVCQHPYTVKVPKEDLYQLAVPGRADMATINYDELRGKDFTENLWASIE